MPKRTSTDDANNSQSQESTQSALPAPIDVTEIRTASLSLIDKLRSIDTISTQAEYNFIVSIGREAQRYLKLADEKLNPNIKRWKDGLDAAKAEKEEIISPFKEAKSLAKTLGEDWLKREKVRKEAEDRALLERINPEVTEHATAIATALVESILPDRALVKTPGSAVRTYKNFRILDASRVHRDFCKPDESLISQLFNSLEDPREIETLVGEPGAVEYYESENLSFRG